MKSKIKILNISIAAALIFSVLLSFVTFEAHCDDLRQNVFRLHILANSDSEEDQALKLAVRDSILQKSDDIFGNSKTLEDAIADAREKLPLIEQIAKQTIKDNGYSYDVRVSISEAFFDTRVYDDFMLPAGVYDALKVEIGEAEGKNWWCVLFPSICIGSAGDLSDTANKGSAQIAKNGGKYIVRFKIVEWYETLKNKIF